MDGGLWNHPHAAAWSSVSLQARLGFSPVAVQAGAEGCWRGRGSRDGVWPHRLLLPQGRGDSPTPLTPFLTPQLGEAIFIINRKKKFSFQLPNIEALMKKENQKILTPLVSLDTPGKATVQVVILADPVSKTGDCG